ncbi:MAG: hypothetical protein M1833_002196 [Piccolia ochrophora]|nr:MAG: hypothetical protein M1833_002196 [Piccolia ochrophora]
MCDNPDIDIASLVAAWASVIVTAAGLAGLFAQADVIKGQLDPFHGCRSVDQLGPWARFEKGHSFLQFRERLTPTAPRGPVLTSSISNGLCGERFIHITRRPQGRHGKEHGRASWTRIFSTFHPRALPVASTDVVHGIDDATITDTEKGSVAVHQIEDDPSGSPSYSWQQRWQELDKKRLAEEQAGLHKGHIKREMDKRFGFQTLTQYNKKPCIKISRTTLITCLVVANAYQCREYIGGAGVRLMFGGYSGSWQIHWPIGSPAMVEFMGLDSEDEELGTWHGQQRLQISHQRVDPTYPPSIPRRVDKCILMLVGVIHGDTLDKLGFPEPEEVESSVLRFSNRGYANHGVSTHLYNIMGGTHTEVDCLFHESWPHTLCPGADGEMRAIGNDGVEAEKAMQLLIPAPRLDLNRKKRKSKDIPHGALSGGWTLWVPKYEQQILSNALDCLPWSYLTWSIHRGMQCILVNYGNRIMNAYRPALAYTLRKAIKDRATELEKRGWSPDFLQERPEAVPSHIKIREDESTSEMAFHAAGAVLKEGGGDSGDSVRVVTDVARILAYRPEQELDKTRFWSDMLGKEVQPVPVKELDPDTVIALVKLFVVQWSNELHHNVWENLPLELLVM